jgi:AbrB family looped-hinge helix DNA binding protein
MTVVTISPKFQVVIPQQIREAMGLEPGQKVEALQVEDRIVLVPVKPISALRGFLRGLDTRMPRDEDRV